MRNDTDAAKRLLMDGADPNEARFPMVGAPALFAPIVNRNSALFRALLDHGADPKIPDSYGNSMLMWAAASEVDDPMMVEELLRRGMDPGHANQAGETALDWALLRGSTKIVAALEKAGASRNPRLRKAVEKSLALLQKSGPVFTKVSGCASCHQQSLPQMAIGQARERGWAIDAAASKQQVAAVLAMYKPMRDFLKSGKSGFPDPPISIGYALLGLHAEGHPADETTEAMAIAIAFTQEADGRFSTMPGRPPMESSEITATALGLRALQLYGPNSDNAVERATQWLITARAQTTEELAMRLLGLSWGSAPPEVQREAAKALLARQRAEGAWAQLEGIESDAYATGQALTALRLSGFMAPEDEAYRRGSAFLLRTQLADGSWLVRSRSFPFQPYKESGYPHGKDQWISAAGASWATMALSLGDTEALRERGSANR
jgi:hypothetical protein